MSPSRSTLEDIGADVQTWTQDLPIKHWQATEKAYPIPTPEPSLTLLETGSPPPPLRDMAGLEVQEREREKARERSEVPWGPAEELK